MLSAHTLSIGRPLLLVAALGLMTFGMAGFSSDADAAPRRPARSYYKAPLQLKSNRGTAVSLNPQPLPPKEILLRSRLAK